MKIAGFDIGGANTDLAVVEFDEAGNIINLRTDFSYLPMWNKKDELSQTLLELLDKDIDDIDAVGISMTAELADSYQSKSEGVLDISGMVMETFNLPVAFVGLNGMMDYESVDLLSMFMYFSENAPSVSIVMLGSCACAMPRYFAASSSVP